MRGYTPDYILEDMRTRLTKATESLHEIAVARTGTRDGYRVAGKKEGVKWCSEFLDSLNDVGDLPQDVLTRFKTTAVAHANEDAQEMVDDFTKLGFQ